MVKPEEFAVLVPDGLGGVAVVTASRFLTALAHGASLDDAIIDAAFDSAETRGEDLWVLVDRVDALNRTGDVNAFWKAS